MATFNLKIFVSNIANVLTQFDGMQVQRSKTGTPYADAELITEAIADAAELVGTNEGPFLVGSLDLLIKVDRGLEQSVTFTLNPSTILDVLTEFNSAVSGATGSNDGGKLRIESDVVGTVSHLELTSGSALTALGFVAGDLDAGEDQNVALVVDQADYEYNDNDGAATYWYRTRYYNSVTGAFSSWSGWKQGSDSAAISTGNLITGYALLADLDGSALADAKIVIRNVYDPSKKEGYGIFGASVALTTDSTGRAEASLVKGSTIDIIFSGTSIIRRIKVPTTGTEFDLLDDTLVVGDQFEIQRPDIPYAPRRS